MSVAKLKYSCFSFLILAFALQQFSIETEISPIKLYMISTFLCGLLLLIFWKNITVPNINLVDASIGLFYCYMILTAFYAEDIILAFRGVLLILVSLVFYLVVRIYANSMPSSFFFRSVKLVGYIFFLGSIFFYLVGLYYLNVYSDTINVEARDEATYYLYGVYLEGNLMPRFRGLADSPNNYCIFTAIFAPFIFGRNSTFNLITAFVIILSVILTLSVTLYVAFVLALLLYLINGRQHLFIKFVRYSIVVFICILFALLLTDINPEEHLNTIMAARIDRINTGSGRFELWEYVIGLVEERPVFGYGLNQSRLLIANLRELKSSHNNFLEVLLDGGMLAFVIYLIMLSVIFYVCRVINKRNAKDGLIPYSALVLFVFSNANVTLYADSTFMFLAFLSYLYSTESAVEMKQFF